MEEESEDESVYDSDSQNVVKNVKNKFVCEMCDFFCSKAFTLSKHKNTKHAGSTRLGPGTFGCFIIARKDMENEAEELRQTWRKEAKKTNHVSFGESLEIFNEDSDEEVKTNEQNDIEYSGEDTDDYDLPDDKSA